MPHPTDVHVGQKIREARLAKGMTLAGLGNEIGCCAQHVFKCEIGECRVSSSRLWMLAAALDKPITYFFAGLPPYRRPAATPEGANA